METRISERWKAFPFNKIISLYDSVGWSAYTNEPDLLRKAFENSSFALIAYEGEEVVGVLRSISDEVSVHYLQDILVCPSHQRRGLGKKLVSLAIKRFEQVRTHILLTDDEGKQKKFYESLEFKNTKNEKLNCFLRARD